jgi:hypothetical protein
MFLGMGGLLTHLVISTVLFALVVVIFRNLWYGLAIFIGQLVPDVVKFGVTGVKLWTTSPSEIIKDGLFWKLEALTSSYHTWVNIGILVLVICLMLYHQNTLKKKQVKEISLGYLMFVIGVAIHLIIDIFIIEKSYWI